MAEASPSYVAEALERNGLTGPAFDVVELEGLMAGWLAAGEELDKLVESVPADDPTSFTPDWT